MSQKNTNLTVLIIAFRRMRRLFALLFSALTLLFACTQEENNGNNGSVTQNNPNELTVTGDALEVTNNSATLTGYANLPLEMGNAIVGVLYDKNPSFENGTKVVATGLDGNNKFTVTATGLEASTTYYFKSYVQNGMAFKYGSVKSFTTQAQRVTSITLDKASLSLVVGAESMIYVTNILPSNADDKSVIWSSSDNTMASVDNNGKVTAKAKGNATIKATANDGSGVFASCSVVVFACPEAIDMGMVINGKNVKWASFNIGASSSEEYGLYFSWGEIEPKSDYSWSTYKFGTSDSGPFSKYNINDNKTDLETGINGDDVASKKLGGKWRMPTHEEWAELLWKQCTSNWTDDYNGTGVKGSIITAVNGNSIFLPAAGQQIGRYLDMAGASVGYYWSSSLDMKHPFYARSVCFTSSPTSIGGEFRNYGHSVRPVYEE